MSREVLKSDVRLLASSWPYKMYMEFIPPVPAEALKSEHLFPVHFPPDSNTAITASAILVPPIGDPDRQMLERLGWDRSTFENRYVNTDESIDRRFVEHASAIAEYVGGVVLNPDAIVRLKETAQ